MGGCGVGGLCMRRCPAELAPRTAVRSCDGLRCDGLRCRCASPGMPRCCWLPRARGCWRGCACARCCTPPSGCRCAWWWAASRWCAASCCCPGWLCTLRNSGREGYGPPRCGRGTSIRTKASHVHVAWRRIPLAGHLWLGARWQTGRGSVGGNGGCWAGGGGSPAAAIAAHPQHVLGRFALFLVLSLMYTPLTNYFQMLACS